ncbi:hypothetical protein Emed_007195 [Eimeria media]
MEKLPMAETAFTILRFAMQQDVLRSGYCMRKAMVVRRHCFALDESNGYQVVSRDIAECFCFYVHHVAPLNDVHDVKYRHHGLLALPERYVLADLQLQETSAGIRIRSHIGRRTWACTDRRAFILEHTAQLQCWVQGQGNALRPQGEAAPVVTR